MPEVNNKLHQILEAVIFSADTPISLKKIGEIIREVDGEKPEKKELKQALEELIEKYDDPTYSIAIVPIAKGYQFMTKSAYHPYIFQKLREQNKKKLTKAAMETLAIIAYKQPVVKTDIEIIRGVNCDYTVQKLLEKELVEISGRADTPGRPMIYQTSEKFMNYFGIKSVKDLPKLKDFEVKENEIGEALDIEEFMTNGEEE